MIVQATGGYNGHDFATKVIFVAGIGPMTPSNFIYYAAARGRTNSQLRLTDQRKAN